MAALAEALKDEVIWSPHPKQARFLSCQDFEVLYGGAAGGGKSDALLIDALGLQQEALEYPSYQAFLMRRSFGDLKDLISRAREIYSQVAPSGKYNPQDHAFTFPSGARVEFIHMHHPDMRFNYRGRVCQYLGVEELTTFASPIVYDYLIGRVRSVNTRLQCYVRSTTNPDGPGEMWVMERFQIPQEGTETFMQLEIPDPETGEIYHRTRRFIPARLRDNPTLTQTPEYKITLLQLPDEEREAMLYGRWGVSKLKGSFYADTLSSLRERGMITNVPYTNGIPVDTYWDIGRRDATAIWFHQRIGMRDNFINYYENSGQPLSSYVKYLQDQPYIYGTHTLPHDAGYERMKRTEREADSWRDMLASLMPNQRISVQRRVKDIYLGIQATRAMLQNAWFDREKCLEGLAALERYKKKWDEKVQIFVDEPVHDWTSHCADAIRVFGERYSQETRNSVITDVDDDDDDDWRTV